MKYIKKSALAAIYQSIADTKNPEPIDTDNKTHKRRAATQLHKKEELETVDMVAMRKAIEVYKDQQAVELEIYFFDLTKEKL